MLISIIQSHLRSAKRWAERLAHPSPNPLPTDPRILAQQITDSLSTLKSANQPKRSNQFKHRKLAHEAHVSGQTDRERESKEDQDLRERKRQTKKEHREKTKLLKSEKRKEVEAQIRRDLEDGKLKEHPRAKREAKREKRRADRKARSERRKAEETLGNEWGGAVGMRGGRVKGRSPRNVVGGGSRKKRKTGDVPEGANAIEIAGTGTAAGKAMRVGEGKRESGMQATREKSGGNGIGERRALGAKKRGVKTANRGVAGGGRNKNNRV